MALNIKDPEADRLAREIAQRTGETLTQAVIQALRDRLAREKRKPRYPEALLEEILAIGQHCAALPLRASRRDDEILGYDTRGIPG